MKERFDWFRANLEQQLRSTNKTIENNEKLKSENQRDMAGEKARKQEIEELLKEQDDIKLAKACLEKSKILRAKYLLQGDPGSSFVFDCFEPFENKIARQRQVTLQQVNKLLALESLSKQLRQENTLHIVITDIKKFESTFEKHQALFKQNPDAIEKKILKAIRYILASVVTGFIYTGIRVAHSYHTKGSVQFWKSRDALLNDAVKHASQLTTGIARR